MPLKTNPLEKDQTSLTHSNTFANSAATIGVVGGGVVGGAVKSFFQLAKVYDKYKPMDSLEEVAQARFIFICVPTPYNDGLDLSIVDEAIAEVVKRMTNPADQLLVLKSTAWPGTTQKYQDQYPQIKFVFNPEFLRDKTANEDFVKNDKQIVGFTSLTKSDPLITELMNILPPAPYKAIVSSETAEMIKYTGNNYLALKVIFANQIYDICEALGGDYERVQKAVVSDKRIGPSHWDIFHTESSLHSTKKESYRGYGGKCFPKDLNSLVKEGNKLGVDVSLFEAARLVNLALNGGRYDQ